MGTKFVEDYADDNSDVRGDGSLHWYPNLYSFGRVDAA
jgi:hypothetical protein